MAEKPSYEDFVQRACESERTHPYNRPILITGCQRSGTTLLHLMLSTHAHVHGIDEMEFDGNCLQKYVTAPDYYPRVSFKLPTYAQALGFIRSLLDVGLRVLWCLRDPRDVIASMLRLQLRLNDRQSVPWVSHPLGGEREINHTFPVLMGRTKKALHSAMERYKKIQNTPHDSRSPADLVFTSALCWRVKHELLPVYDKEGVPYTLVCYEKLIADPEKAIRPVLDFVGLSWDGNVLAHHRFHSGKRVGDTDAARPVDSTNTGKWKRVLSSRDLSMVSEVCGELPSRLGYGPL